MQVNVFLTQMAACDNIKNFRKVGGGANCSAGQYISYITFIIPALQRA